MTNLPSYTLVSFRKPFARYTHSYHQICCLLSRNLSVVQKMQASQKCTAHAPARQQASGTLLSKGHCWGLRPRVQLQHQRTHSSSWVVRSAKCAELLKQAKTKYTAKDLMGALKLYEDVLAQDDLTTRQKQEALYGQTAVHATFGDVELAQITLREGLKCGLDFEQALSDPDLVEVVASTQILIQLKRFNQSAQQAQSARSRSIKMGGSSSGSSSSSFGSRARTKPAAGGSPLDQDLGSILGTPDSDTAGVDTSIGAIVRRVLLVILAAVGLGTALFFIGLEYLFPKY